MTQYLATYSVLGQEKAPERLIVLVNLISTFHGTFTEKAEIATPVTAAGFNAAIRSVAASIANTSLSAGIAESDVLLFGGAA